MLIEANFAEHEGLARGQLLVSVRGAAKKMGNEQNTRILLSTKMREGE